MVAVASWRTQGSLAYLVWALVGILPLVFLMFWQVYRGRWGNVDASNPSERPALFAGTLLILGLLLWWLWISDSAAILIRGVVIAAILLVVSAIITYWIKLSLHSAFAAMATVALSLHDSTVGYLLIGVTPVLVWSRLVLSRHTKAEIAAGLIVGVAAGLALVYA